MGSDKVIRPWGHYAVLAEGENFKVKRIAVDPGASLSMQSHVHRSEHWVVLEGTACVVLGDETVHLGSNESTFVPAGARHRLSNPGKVPLIIVEIATGVYLGEDDIVRYEDAYGRV